MIPKIAIVGPESTGKSSLAADLAQHYQVDWVREYAREYLDQLGRDYVQSDLLEIAHGQLKLEDAGLQKKPKLLICDTNLIVIKIWSEFKYARCDQALQLLFNFSEYPLYLLCDIDVPWTYDSQREHPHLRQELLDMYKKELEQEKLNYVIISGAKEERLQTAVKEINSQIFAKQ
ncbi:MAG: ATP-binding protein [Bacteroidota bacterium]